MKVKSTGGVIRVIIVGWGVTPGGILINEFYYQAGYHIKLFNLSFKEATELILNSVASSLRVPVRNVYCMDVYEVYSKKFLDNPYAENILCLKTNKLFSYVLES